MSDDKKPPEFFDIPAIDVRNDTSDDLVSRLMDYDKCHDGDVDEAAKRIETLERQLAASESRVNELLMEVAGTNFHALPSASFREMELERELAVLRRRWETLSQRAENHRHGTANLWTVRWMEGDTFADAVDALSKEQP